MLATELINFDIPFIRPADTVFRALEMMHDVHQRELPVIEDKQYMGMLSEEFLLNYDDEQIISELVHFNETPELFEKQHLLQLPSFFNQKNNSMLPVLDSEGSFKGVILQADVNKQIVDSIFSENVGMASILLNNKDYSLSAISRIAETENVKIFKVFVSRSENDEEKDLQVLLQFNTLEISAALNSLRRFGYNAENLTPGLEMESIDKDRYEMLMKYLEI